MLDEEKNKNLVHYLNKLKLLQMTEPNVKEILKWKEE